MDGSRQRPELSPRALRLFGSPAARSEFLTVLMLIAGTAAIAAFADIAGLLARWSTHPHSWLLGELWVMPVVMSIAFGIIAIRRMRELGAEVLRRRAAEDRLAEGIAPSADLVAPAAPDGPAEGSSEWAWEIDADQHLTIVSERAPAVLIELAKARAPWRPGGPLIDDDAWVRHRADLVRGRAFQDFEFRIADPDGQERHLQISGWPVHDRAGGLAGFRGIGTDVTRAAVAEAQVRHLAAHDPMTGLAHRGELHERLTQALARAPRRAGGAAVPQPGPVQRDQRHAGPPHRRSADPGLQRPAARRCRSGGPDRPDRR